MEWLTSRRWKAPVKAVLFDFDGTVSTLRQGWEQVMEPMMVEYLSRGDSDEKTMHLVRAYIDESTGIQTIFQMKWLAEQVSAQGGDPLDPWEYKAEYNRRLMENVAARRELVGRGRVPAGEYLVGGAAACLKLLADRGIRLYVASGTDDDDVRTEAAVLGLDRYFTRIQGAPAGREDCSKDAVLRMLVEEEGFSGDSLAVVGDGKVEIAIGRESGARTLGIASDEANRTGINPDKYRRLVGAGADAITGDFTETKELRLFFLGEGL